MQTTPNYALKKIELTDSPPDITVLNANWDTIDAEVKEIDTKTKPIEEGGTGANTVALARNALGLGNTDGALPIANGGTGQSTAALARNALGLGNTIGALPIANGGTGATTAALARNALGLGNTSGALPIANGGTGATTAALALNGLGVTATAAEVNQVSQKLGDDMVINNDFRIWERGTSFTSMGIGTGIFTADWWKLFGTSGVVVSNNSGRMRITPGSRSFYILQYVDDDRTYGDVTLSFKATIPSGVTFNCYAWIDGFQRLSASFTGTGTLSTYAVTFNIPGQRTPGSYIELRLFSNLVTSGTIDVEYVKLQKGTIPTPHQSRPYATEIALCQRYYYNSGNDTTGAWCGVVFANTAVACPVKFPVRMKKTPTNLSIIGNGQVNYVRDSQYGSVVSLSGSQVYSLNQYGFSFIGSIQTTCTNGAGVDFNVIAEIVSLP